MAVDCVSFGGWEKNLRLRNEYAELIITLEVGPRVISYRTRGGSNVFKTFDSHLGGAGESEWKARGGHRFWLAPEDEVLSYIPDNSPVQHRVVSDFVVEIENEPNEQLPVRKTLRVSLAENSTAVSVIHRAENRGPRPLEMATWGLSVMKPGGIEIIPLPPLGQHPRDLLPNRAMVLWPYSNMADPRWHWGERFITLRQADGSPTKLGLRHQERWAAYHRGDTLFIKTLELQEGATYPDRGCNFETFTNDEMLEIEALGPLLKLASGEAAEHAEGWQLFEGVGACPSEGDDAIAAWLEPWLKRAGLAL